MRSGILKKTPDTIFDIDRSALVNGSFSYNLFNSPTGPQGDTVLRLRPSYDYESFVSTRDTTNRFCLAGVTFNALATFVGSILDVYDFYSPGVVGNDQLLFSNQYPVEPGAIPRVPRGPQMGYTTQNCLIDAGFVGPESVFVQNNNNNGYKFLFIAFPVAHLSPPNGVIDLVAVNIATNTPADSIIATLVPPGGSEVLSFRSIASAREKGLYMNLQSFGTDRYPQGQLFYFNYYPFSNGLQLLGSDLLTTSSAMFSGALDSTTGLQRWGDYTSAVWQVPFFPGWPQSVYFIDEYTPDGTEQSRNIRGFTPPNF